MSMVGQKLWHMLCVFVLMFEYGVSDDLGLEHFPLHNVAILWKPYLDLVNCSAVAYCFPLYSRSRLYLSGFCQRSRTSKREKICCRNQPSHMIEGASWASMTSVRQEVREDRVELLGIGRARLLFTTRIYSSAKPQLHSSGLSTDSSRLTQLI